MAEQTPFGEPSQSFLDKCATMTEPNHVRFGTIMITLSMLRMSKKNLWEKDIQPKILAELSASASEVSEVLKESKESEESGFNHIKQYVGQFLINTGIFHAYSATATATAKQSLDDLTDKIKNDRDTAAVCFRNNERCESYESTYATYIRNLILLIKSRFNLFVDGHKKMIASDLAEHFPKIEKLCITRPPCKKPPLELEDVRPFKEDSDEEEPEVDEFGNYI
uniref:Uncharacterized protein n=1 Tax=viral metagenome TaxID=1070528 RepID=A0A6C0HN95_9ZZZZ